MKISRTVCATIAGVLLFQLAAQAQSSNAPVRPRQRNVPAAIPVDGFGNVLTILSPEQRASMRRNMDEHAAKRRDIESRLAAAREALVDVISTNFNELEARKRAAAVSALDAEMSVLRMKMLSQVQPPLSSEQIQRIKAAQTIGLQGRGRANRSQEEPPSQRAPNRDENGLPPKQ